MITFSVILLTHTDTHTYRTDYITFPTLLAEITSINTGQLHSFPYW